MPPLAARLPQLRRLVLAATGRAAPRFRTDTLLILCDAADELAADMQAAGDPAAAEVAAAAGELRALAPIFATQ